MDDGVLDNRVTVREPRPIPVFQSVAEAEAWMEAEEQEHAKFRAAEEAYRDHLRIAHDILFVPGPVWKNDRGQHVLYSTARMPGTGKFAVVVFRGALGGEAVYCREFTRRKDAKARALVLWDAGNKAPQAKARKR